MYNENKIAFIFCCNDVQYQKECSSYIMELDLPAEYELEILPIIGAKSMAQDITRPFKSQMLNIKYIYTKTFLYGTNILSMIS